MVEVFAILVALAALLLGLLAISWTYGDFRRQPAAPSSQQTGQAPPGSAS